MIRSVIKLALLLAAVALTTSTSAVILVKKGAGAPSSCTNTSVTFWWRLEGDTITTGDYSAGDTSATLTNAIIDSTLAQMGTNGLRTTSTAAVTHALFAISSDNILNDCTSRVGFWFRYATGAWNGADVRLFRFDDGGANRADIRTLATEGYLRLNYDTAADAARTVDTTSAVLTANTWHYIEAMWDCSQAAGSDVLRLKVDNTTVAESTTATMSSFGTNASSMYVGNNNTVYWAGAVYYDQVIVSSDITKDLYECRNNTSYP